MTEFCSITVMTRFVFGVPCDCAWANSHGSAAVSGELPAAALGHLEWGFGAQSPASSERLEEINEFSSLFYWIVLK